MRKNTLFTVPLFCIAASIISFYLIVYVIGRFILVTLPDGSIASDESRVLLVYGFMMYISLFAGGLLLFHKMTRAEIALSATIWAVFHLVLLAVGYAVPMTGRAAMTYSLLSMSNDWCSVIPLLAMRFTDSTLFSAILAALTPYLLVLFGKKRPKKEDTAKRGPA